MEAIQPNPTETLDHQPPPSYADPSPPPPPPTTQTLPENPTENGNGGSSSDAAVRAAVTHLTNGLTTSATERDASGGEEETTSRRRRRSRWDPQPESENAGEDSGKRKRKSRWADEEPKPVVQLPEFMGGIEFDPEIQALNSRLLEISRILYSGMPLGKRKRKSRWADEEPKPVVQLPEFMGGIEFDPEIQASNSRLLEISRILYSGLPLGKRKRKSRWADEEPKPVVQLPEFMGGIEFDPEIQALNSRLLEISRILYSGLPLDDRPEGARSRVYDNMRIRINTREFRARERLNRERQEIIAQILKRNPNFKPPETWDYSSDSFC